MCGRYHIEDELSNDRVQKLLGLTRDRYRDDPRLKVMATDTIYPSDLVPILGGAQPLPYLAWWGFPGFKGAQIIINARAETLRTKPTFAASFEQGRCLVPADSFFEWYQDKQISKDPLRLRVEDTPLFYMAGLIRPGDPDRIPKRHQKVQEEARQLGLSDLSFMTIVTTKANASMADVHHRMPLILSREEAHAWLTDEEEAQRILASPCTIELLKQAKDSDNAG